MGLDDEMAESGLLLVELAPSTSADRLAAIDGIEAVDGIGTQQVL